MRLVKEPQKSEILIYQNTDGRIKIDVMLDEETVWLTIDQMAELFQKSRSTINEHILNIYKEGELEEEASLRKIGNSDFSVKPTNYYNLDVIISVGYRRANSTLPRMGMQSLDKTDEVAIRKQDAAIAKNYLSEDEIKLLGLLVEQYLAFADTMAQQHIPMYMNDWIERLDSIIQLNGRELLSHAGKISHSQALEKSAQEYEKYRVEQKTLSKEASLQELEMDIKGLQGITSGKEGGK